MQYSFIAFGHSNITAKHKSTIELTKGKDLDLEGDCIIGVNSDFKIDKIKEIIKNNKKAGLVIKVNGLKEEINFEVNPGFNDDKEIVIRKSDFKSERTLGVKADKACAELSRELVEKLKDPNQKISVLITNI